MFDAALAGQFDLVTSPALLDELRRVLAYPRLHRKAYPRPRSVAAWTEARDGILDHGGPRPHLRRAAAHPAGEQPVRRAHRPNRRHDLVRKRAIYEEFGVPELWFVDTDARTVEQCVLTGGEYASTSHGPGATVRAARLDGLAVAVDDLFT